MNNEWKVNEDVTLVTPMETVKVSVETLDDLKKAISEAARKAGYKTFEVKYDGRTVLPSEITLDMTTLEINPYNKAAADEAWAVPEKSLVVVCAPSKCYNVEVDTVAALQDEVRRIAKVEGLKTFKVFNSADVEIFPKDITLEVKSISIKPYNKAA